MSDELYTDEELQLRIAHELDVVDFLDIIEMPFAELLTIIFPELDEEQREALKRNLTS